jgi:hypothetical protein
MPVSRLLHACAVQSSLVGHPLSGSAVPMVPLIILAMWLPF